MADHQRVHPAQVSPAAAADIENPAAAAPLFPRNTTKSDQNHQIPIPKRHRRGTRKSCLPRCLCWSFLVLILILVLIAATLGSLYLIFRPKLPEYSVDALRITDLSATAENRLSAAFGVNITAKNPNDKIGIYYEGGSKIGVWYNSAELTTGALPEFYQGHRNTTVLSLSLSGQSSDGMALLSAVQTDLARLGYVPLLVNVKQPVRVRLGRLKLFKVRFLVRCSLAVDNLSPNDNIRIRSSTCKFRFRL